MPIYGFTCNACGKEFQTLVRASDSPACPSCDSTELTRQLSLIAQPARGGDTAPSACVSSDMPPCASGACCFGGGCG